jgi:hypothetical protein
MWTHFIQFRVVQCEHGDEPSGSIESGEFSDYLSEY